MGETWRQVVGFEGAYEVSDQGRVRGVPRQGCRGKILNGFLVGSPPYRTVDLSYRGVRKSSRVHSLVAAAFHGQRPVKWDVAHNNGDRFDNRASNLRYASRAENNKDKRQHGRVPMGSKTSAAKINEMQAREIRELEGRLSSREVGALYGLGHAAVLCIWRRKNWTHV